MTEGATTDSRNIVERMAAIMAEIDHVGKTGQNREQNYNFRPIDEFMNALNGPLSRHQVVVTPRVLERTSFERVRNDRGGVTRVVEMLVEFTFTAPDLTSLVVVTAGEGADVADKATNKAMAGALKYAIMQTFMVPTRELNDGDADSPEITSAQQSQANAHPPMPTRPEIEAKLNATVEGIGKPVSELRSWWQQQTGIDALIELDDLALYDFTRAVIAHRAELSS